MRLIDIFKTAYIYKKMYLLLLKLTKTILRILLKFWCYMLD